MVIVEEAVCVAVVILPQSHNISDKITHWPYSRHWLIHIDILSFDLALKNGPLTLCINRCNHVHSEARAWTFLDTSGTFAVSPFVRGLLVLVPYKLVHQPYSPHNTVTIPHKVLSSGLESGLILEVHLQHFVVPSPLRWSCECSS